ncbi:hypothetical protein M885DRAFT_564725 [Pelagophyceae sp. CCMP2097]|nr:hypothetical protein M885DRAFT_564725 [Pelagophyceae sp. CCMP2097]
MRLSVLLALLARGAAFSAPAARGPQRTKALRVAPSGIDALPLAQQAAVFFGTFAGLGGATAVSTAALESAAQKFQAVRTWKKTLPLLGAVYVAAGFAHFGVQDAFTSIYPPQGTWGLWYLPGSAEFHVAWTGVAEGAGGAALLVGGAARLVDGAPKQLKDLAPIGAAALLALTFAVTPANIYMYTHGAIMVGAGPPGALDVSFHYVRFAAQVVLLSILKTIADDKEPL